MKHTLFSLLVLIIFLSGCKKESKSSPDPDIYIVGKEYDATTSRLYPKYWKNGVGTNLADGGEATAIVVVNDDVYISGYGSNSSGKSVAKYWKNGVEHVLTDGSSSAVAYNIAVSGPDVHVVGALNNSVGFPIATYWKNGAEYSLAGVASGSTARSISIDGSDVYISGNETNALGNSIATYWKNRTKYNLADGTKFTIACAILAKSSNVYVSVFENAQSFHKVLFWSKSSFQTVFSDSLHTAFLGNNIVQSGNDIYYTGSIDDGKPGNHIAYYWKNHVRYALSDGSRFSQGTSIAVSGDDVYVAGWAFNGTANIPKYWKNGTETILSEKPGYAYGIFVK